jgi:hypothetical protein
VPAKLIAFPAITRKPTLSADGKPQILFKPNPTGWEDKVAPVILQITVSFPVLRLLSREDIRATN